MDELLKVPTTKELTEAEFDALQFDALLEQPETAEVPTTPSAPKAPSVPKAPTAPKAPGAPVESSAKVSVLNLIKELTDTHKVEPNDITQLMSETTGFDTIGKVPEDKLALLLDQLNGWITDITYCNETVEAMKAIAEPLGYSGDLEDGIASILEPHDADCIGLIHYSNMDAVKEQFNAYLKTWQEL